MDSYSKDRLDDASAPRAPKVRWWYRLLPQRVRRHLIPRPEDAPDSDSIAIGGVVRLLCDVRLVALMACGFEMIAARPAGSSDPRLVLMLLLLPFSYVPLRSWWTRGGLFTDSTILARCDIILTIVTVLFCLDIQSVGLYSAAGVAMLGVIYGTRWAMVAAPPIAFIQINGMILLDSFGVNPMGALLPVVTLSMAWCGGRLGVLLREQASARKAARAADARAAAAEERLRLARNLHDTVVGEIAGLQWLVIRLKEVASKGDQEELARLVATMEAACAMAYADSRLMLEELRTSTSDSELDTGPGLANRVDSWSQRHGIDARYEITSEVGFLSARVLLETQAVTSELLENVRRHAKATKVVVRAWTEDVGRRQVVIEVEDDGVGFPKDFDPLGPHVDGRSHYGLRGIQERIAVHGGRLDIRAGPARGAVVSVRLSEPDLLAAVQGGATIREEATS